MSPFNNRNRKDEELYQFFRQQGVPAANMIFLKDQQATLSGIQSAMKSLLEKSNTSSTFIFYYAGHGVRAGNGPVSFANYDYASGQEFSVSTISKATNGIDRWFLYEIQKICNLEKEIAKYDLADLPLDLLREAKVNGFSDEQISRILEHGDEEDVYKIAKAVYDNLDELEEIFDGAKQINRSTLAETPMPLHPGAKRYFDEK